MADFRKLAISAVLADGKVDETEVKVLQRGLKGDSGGYDDDALRFLIELRETAQKKAKALQQALTDSFEKFFFKVMGDVVLKDGKIDAGEVTWLRQHLLADGKIDDGEWQFLQTLNKKAKTKDASFDTMFKEFEGKRAKAKK